MSNSSSSASSLSSSSLLIENARLRSRIAELEFELQTRNSSTNKQADGNSTSTSASINNAAATASVTSAAVEFDIPSAFSPVSLSQRSLFSYGRQLLVPEFGGAKTLLAMQQKKILIVGAGGLGCPAAIYLSASGIRHLTVVDGDRVDRSNLHRQIGHDLNSIGRWKSESLIERCAALNSELVGVAVNEFMSESNALELVSSHDLVLDCTDNVPTRYLLNDSCVIAGRPLISGSALRFEGQLTVYGWRSGPCYRCLFPVPPHYLSVTNCSDGGIIGPVTGIIGAAQAMETIKIIAVEAAAHSDNHNSTDSALQPLSGRLLVFDGSTGDFRCVRLRNKNPNCEACGKSPKFSREAFLSGSINYRVECGSEFNDNSLLTAHSLDSELSIAPEELQAIINSNNQHQADHTQSADDSDSSTATATASVTSSAAASDCLLIDVRDRIQFDLCRLNNSISIPLKLLKQSNGEGISLVEAAIRDRLALSNSRNSLISVIFVCRRGLDSLRATQFVTERKAGICSNLVRKIIFRNLRGGLMAWHSIIDEKFPIY